MSLPTSIAIYFIIWWMVLFAVLPWGVRSQHEDGAIAPGSDPGAPAIPISGANWFGPRSLRASSLRSGTSFIPTG